MNWYSVRIIIKNVKFTHFGHESINTLNRLIIYVIFCGSDRNIRPEVTRPWAVYRGTDIPIRTANICQIFCLAFSTLFHFILNSLSLFSMKIYIITTVNDVILTVPLYSTRLMKFPGWVKLSDMQEKLL
jgi:hypothetical protein